MGRCGGCSYLEEIRHVQRVHERDNVAVAGRGEEVEHMDAGVGDGEYPPPVTCTALRGKGRRGVWKRG